MPLRAALVEARSGLLVGFRFATSACCSASRAARAAASRAAAFAGSTGVRQLAERVGGARGLL